MLVLDLRNTGSLQHLHVLFKFLHLEVEVLNLEVLLLLLLLQVLDLDVRVLLADQVVENGGVVAVIAEARPLSATLIMMLLFNLRVLKGELMMKPLELINVNEKHHILGHLARVLRLVQVLVLVQLSPQTVQIAFQVLSLAGLFDVHVCVALLILGVLLEHVHLVESNDSFLQLLVVGDVVQALEDVVLELLLQLVLPVDVFVQLLRLFVQSFLLELQIFDDELQVAVDTTEVLRLLVHLRRLLVQLLNIVSFWTNLALELLDLVIKHKFKLLQLLALLLQIVDFLVFVLNCSVTFSQLTLLTFDRRSQSRGHRDLCLQLVFHRLNVQVASIFFSPLILVFIVD